MSAGLAQLATALCGLLCMAGGYESLTHIGEGGVCAQLPHTCMDWTGMIWTAWAQVGLRGGVQLVCQLMHCPCTLQPACS